MATGFTAGAHEAMIGQANALKSQIEEAGQEVLATFNALVGEGLQGNAADATQGLAQDVNQATQNANEAVATLQQHTTQFGENMGSVDNTFAGRIGG